MQAGAAGQWPPERARLKSTAAVRRRWPAQRSAASSGTRVARVRSASCSRRLRRRTPRARQRCAPCRTCRSTTQEPSLQLLNESRQDVNRTGKAATSTTPSAANAPRAANNKLAIWRPRTCRAVRSDTSAVLTEQVSTQSSR